MGRSFRGAKELGVFLKKSYPNFFFEPNNGLNVFELCLSKSELDTGGNWSFCIIGPPIFDNNCDLASGGSIFKYASFSGVRIDCCPIATNGVNNVNNLKKILIGKAL